MLEYNFFPLSRENDVHDVQTTNLLLLPTTYYLYIYLSFIYKYKIISFLLE